MSDAWDDGAAYDGYVGRWSRLIAREFIRRLDVPAASAWLDFGCGTGALTRAILALASPRRVVGCDRSPGYVDFAQRQTLDARARFVVASLPDVAALDERFDACVSGLVLNFLPSPAEAVPTLASRVRVGGTLAAYVWDHADGMALIRRFWDAAIAIDPSARALDEAVRFPLCEPDGLRRLFAEARLDQVTVEAIEVPTAFDSFEDYWRPFLGGQGPAPGYAMSLSADARERLRAAIASQMPIAPDGSIHLTARAWAVRGTVVT
jgi:SAM-dependent methyltransferase